ncbi:MAG: MarR family transcriptional regulator [Bacteroidia bacterium]|nr:MarR family transcriptional regulator [Bacteroidia bacterium]
MNIEEAIKQRTPFRNPWHKLAVNLIYSHNWLMDHHKSSFKPYDITVQQYNVLRILRGQYPNPISTSDIRSRMLDKMSDVSRIVDRLVRKELLTRVVCPSDKRLVDVVITEKGLGLLKELDDLNNQMDLLARHLTHEEAELLSQLLDKMRG